jgi:hypothetical protein
MTDREAEFFLQSMGFATCFSPITQPYADRGQTLISAVAPIFDGAITIYVVAWSGGEVVSVGGQAV